MNDNPGAANGPSSRKHRRRKSLALSPGEHVGVFCHRCADADCITGIGSWPVAGTRPVYCTRIEHDTAHSDALIALIAANLLIPST